MLIVPLPEYTIDTEPDHRRIGRQVDDVLRSRFTGRTIVARGLSVDDHPDLSGDDLIAFILSTGTDRYDPDRRGDRYDNVDGKVIDLFGLRRTVTPRMTLFAELSWGFFHGSIEIHGIAKRLDVLTVYDARRLRSVLHRYEGQADRKRDGFRFVDPSHRVDALLGVVRITR